MAYTVIIEDILLGKFKGVKFESERFEQDARTIDTPEPLDFHEKKALLKMLMLEVYAQAIKNANSVAEFGEHFRKEVDKL